MQMAALCRENDINLVLLSPPSRMKRSTYYDPKHFTRYNEEIRRCSETAGCLFIDMHELMGHEADLFLDELHYSPERIEKFAQILFERLR